MCIALPMRIAAVVDAGARTVRLDPDPAIAPDRSSGEIVSAVLVAGSESELSGLVGRWAISHAGFLLALLDEEDARSRLALFIAMDAPGQPIGCPADDVRPGASGPPHETG